MKKRTESSQGVFPPALQDGPIAVAEGISVLVHARLVSAEARVHVLAHQAVARPAPENVNLNVFWTGNLQRPYLSCSVTFPYNSIQIFW